MVHKTQGCINCKKRKLKVWMGSRCPIDEIGLIFLSSVIYHAQDVRDASE